MKLFDIDERLAACVKLDESRVVDTESGEIIDLEAIAALEMERDKKIENLGCWYKNLLADAEALKAQKNAFAEREKAAKAKAESLKGFLGRYLNGKKFETAKVAMSFGGASAGAGMLVPVLQSNFHIKQMDIRSSVDFTSSGTRVYAHADIRIRPIAAIAIAAVAGVKLLKVLIQKKTAKAEQPEPETQKGK